MQIYTKYFFVDTREKRSSDEKEKVKNGGGYKEGAKKFDFFTPSI